MQLITNTGLAERIIAHYNTFLSIAATEADLTFLQMPAPVQSEGGTVIEQQNIRHIHNCIEQNTLLSVNLNLQFLNSMIVRAVQQINTENHHANNMVERHISLVTKTSPNIVYVNTAETKKLQAVSMITMTQPDKLQKPMQTLLHRLSEQSQTAAVNPIVLAHPELTARDDMNTETRPSVTSVNNLQSAISSVPLSHGVADTAHTIAPQVQPQTEIPTIPLVHSVADTAHTTAPQVSLKAEVPTIPLVHSTVDTAHTTAPQVSPKAEVPTIPLVHSTVDTAHTTAPQVSPKAEIPTIPLVHSIADTAHATAPQVSPKAEVPTIPLVHSTVDTAHTTEPQVSPKAEVPTIPLVHSTADMAHTTAPQASPKAEIPTIPLVHSMADTKHTKAPQVPQKAEIPTIPLVHSIADTAHTTAAEVPPKVIPQIPPKAEMTAIPLVHAANNPQTVPSQADISPEGAVYAAKNKAEDSKQQITVPPLALSHMPISSTPLSHLAMTQAPLTISAHHLARMSRFALPNLTEKLQQKPTAETRQNSPTAVEWVQSETQVPQLAFMENFAEQPSYAAGKEAALHHGVAHVTQRSDTPVARVLPNSIPRQIQSAEAEPEADLMEIPTVRVKKNVTQETQQQTSSGSHLINAPQGTVQSVLNEQQKELPEAEVQRITEKVYHAIENRLRSEKMRRGRW